VAALLVIFQKDNIKKFNDCCCHLEYNTVLGKREEEELSLVAIIISYATFAMMMLNLFSFIHSWQHSD